MSFLPAFIFPNFNLYSTPLLILVLQGLIFGVLLLIRFKQKKNISDVLLAFILLITCYHRTTYTIGFMDWYDTYRNTKINYYLISLGMVLAPMIYFYVKSVTTSDFRFKKRDVWHFVPWILFFFAKAFIFMYDFSQLGFYETQNGPMVVNFEWKYLSPIITLLSTFQMLLYLAFTFQHFFQYKSKIQQYFSNTYQLELNWIRNFLYVYAFIFLYGFVQIFINEVIVELSWMQKWWLQFCSALVVIYVGIKGYFTNTITLSSLNFESRSETISSKTNAPSVAVSNEVKIKKEQIQNYFESEKPFLNPDLNLSELAKNLQMHRAELSEIINTGFGQNFNDFVNSFRVDFFKQKLSEGAHKQLSLLGIAYDSGFNSKATFNRVFKKLTNTSPTEFLKSLPK
jgi:AraC-like DNA-binding protein